VTHSVVQDNQEAREMLRSRTWLAWTVATTVGLILAMPVSAVAMTVRQGDSAGVAKGETLADDLYAFGNTVTVDGTVDGDVVAFAQVVVINGHVSGSVISAAQTVRIDGTVGGSVRAAGSTVDVGGTVDGDVLAGANQVTVSGEVKRDVAAGAQAVSLTDMVGRNVMTGSESLTIAGKVGGNVQAQSNRVTVAKDGSVAGNLEYWSAEDASVQGSVAGQTSRHEPQKQAQGPTGAAGMASTVLDAVVAWIESLLGFLLLGLLMVYALRRPTEGGSQVVLDRVWPSLGVGALVFFSAPMAFIFVFVVGLFFGAWWLAFVLMAAFWLLLLAGAIVGGLAVGRAILRRFVAADEPSLTISLLVGLTLVWLVGAIPFLGAFVGWVVMLLGTGALVLLWMGKGEAPAAAVPSSQPPIL
jgi:cytoskeletal protein CcmA (bactofilin family)